MDGKDWMNGHKPRNLKEWLYELIGWGLGLGYAIFFLKEQCSP